MGGRVDRGQPQAPRRDDPRHGNGPPGEPRRAEGSRPSPRHGGQHEPEEQPQDRSRSPVRGGVEHGSIGGQKLGHVEATSERDRQQRPVPPAGLDQLGRPGAGRTRRGGWLGAHQLRLAARVGPAPARRGRSGWGPDRVEVRSWAGRSYQSSNPVGGRPELSVGETWSRPVSSSCGGAGGEPADVLERARGGRLFPMAASPASDRRPHPFPVGVMSRDGEVPEEGGDRACWQARVCPHCGGFAVQDPPTACPECHQVIEG